MNTTQDYLYRIVNQGGILLNSNKKLVIFTVCKQIIDIKIDRKTWCIEILILEIILIRLNKW